MTRNEKKKDSKSCSNKVAQNGQYRRGEPDLTSLNWYLIVFKSSGYVKIRQDRTEQERTAKDRRVLDWTGLD